MKDLVIIGASGHGKVVADIATKMNNWRSIAFLDDDESISSSMNIKIIGKSSDVSKYKSEADFFVAIGNNSTRKIIQDKLEEDGFNIVSLVHPSAVIGAEVEIGIGTVVMAGVVINASTKIGKGCIINTSSSLDHDNAIEDYVHISPGVNLAGTVKIGKESWIGIGSTIINNVSICSGCIVGAGSVVLKDITQQGTYVGAPVRKID